MKSTKVLHQNGRIIKVTSEDSISEAEKETDVSDLGCKLLLRYLGEALEPKDAFKKAHDRLKPSIAEPTKKKRKSKLKNPPAS